MAEEARGTARQGGEKEAGPTRGKRRRRLLRRLLLLAVAALLFLGVLIACLPMILSTGPGNRLILAIARRWLPEGTRVGRISLGWTSGIRVRDVRIPNPEGFRDGDAIRIEEIAASGYSLVPVRSVRWPHLQVHVGRLRLERRADGSTNWGRIAGAWLGRSRGRGEEAGGERRPPEGEPGSGRGGGLVSSILPSFLVLCTLDVDELSVVDGASGPEPGTPASLVLGDVRGSLLARLVEGAVVSQSGSLSVPVGADGTVSATWERPGPGEGIEGTLSVDIKAVRLESFSPWITPALGVDRVTGTLQGKASAATRRSGQVAAKVRLRASDLVLAGGAAGREPIEEERVRLIASVGFDEATRVLRIAPCELAAESARVRLQGRVDLSGPVPAPDLEGEADLDLGGLATALAGALDLGVGLRGRAEFTLKGRRTEAGAAEASIAGRIAGLVVAPPGRPPIRESEVTVAAAASIGRDAVRIERAGVEASGLDLSVSGDVKGLEEAPRLDLSGRLDGDLARLGPFLPEKTRISGGVRTRAIRLEGPLAAPRVHLEAEFAPLKLEVPAAMALDEERVEIALDGIWERDRDRMAAESLRVRSAVLALDGRGALARGVARVRARLASDLVRMARVLAPVMPEGLVLAGAGKGEIRLDGPIGGDVKALAAEGELNVPEARYEGEVLRDARIPFRLREGVLEIAQIEGELDGGDAAATARIDLRAERPRYDATLDLDRVALDRGGGQLLRYVIPVLAGPADIVRAEARFSGRIRASGEGFSKEAIEKGLNVQGDLGSLDGRIVGSPVLAQALAPLGREAELGFRSIAASFGIRKGIIDAESVRIAGEDLSLVLRGKATLAGELDFALDVRTLLERMPGKGRDLERALRALKGAPIPVRIRGTVDRPQVAVDAAAFRDRLRELAREALRREAVERGAREIERHVGRDGKRALEGLLKVLEGGDWRKILEGGEEKPKKP